MPSNTGSSTVKYGTCLADVYDPVCAQDGKEYNNSCLAKQSHAVVVFSGACQEMRKQQIDKSAAVSSGGHIHSEGKTILQIDGDSGSVHMTMSGTNMVLGGVSSSETGELINEYSMMLSSSGGFDAYSTGSYHHYVNEHLRYAFAMPNYSYYQGYGAQDGAQHTMAIALTASGIEQFSEAPVQVFFYKKAPTIVPSTQSVTLADESVVYVRTQAELTEREQRIVHTILESAHTVVSEIVTE